MDQSVNFNNDMPMNNFAFNGVATPSSMPSTTEHRSVLVSRKFINGLVTNYNKSKNSFVQPGFETPNFEAPKFDFSAEQPISPVNPVVAPIAAPVAEVPSYEPVQATVAPVMPVAPVETPSFEAPKFEVPKFDFTAQQSVEEPQTVTQVEPVTPIVNVPKFEFNPTAVSVAPVETPAVASAFEMPKISVEETPAEDETPASDEGTAINISNYNNFEGITNDELLAKYANIDGISTETMLFEVQNTLNSLANMVSVLTQQRTDLMAQQEEIADANEALDKRQETIELKEKAVEDAEEANEVQRQEIEKLAADNARQLSERTLALKAKAQELEDKERAYMNKVEELNKDIAKNVENAKNLKKRAEELNAKEAELDKLSIELKGRLNNLVDAENKFKVIVKEFNDTVNFNNTLNSIASPIKQLKKELSEEKAA